MSHFVPLNSIKQLITNSLKYKNLVWIVLLKKD